MDFSNPRAMSAGRTSKIVEEAVNCLLQVPDSVRGFILIALFEEEAGAVELAVSLEQNRGQLGFEADAGDFSDLIEQFVELGRGLGDNLDFHREIFAVGREEGLARFKVCNNLPITIRNSHDFSRKDRPGQAVDGLFFILDGGSIMKRRKFVQQGNVLYHLVLKLRVSKPA